MAELLIGLLQLTAGSLQARPLLVAEHEVAAEPLPPPIIPDNYDKRAASCMMNVRAERALAGVASAACLPSLGGSRGNFVIQRPLPSPLAKSTTLQRNFEDVVVEKKGFKWVNERPDAKTENDEKWGWIGSKPGDFVVMRVDSRSSGEAAGDASIGGCWGWAVRGQAEVTWGAGRGWGGKVGCYRLQVSAAWLHPRHASA